VQDVRPYARRRNLRQSAAFAGSLG